MLGYSVHFAQMECLKLIAGATFAEKRVGYLGLMSILDERTDVLMLVTNSIQLDLNHPSQHIVGLALSALGNVSSPSIARDLCGDVAKLLSCVIFLL
jgi:AP-1 complex subunit gamma-1